MKKLLFAGVFLQPAFSARMISQPAAQNTENASYRRATVHRQS